MISSQNLAKKEKNKNNVNNKTATGISKIKMQFQIAISKLLEKKLQIKLQQIQSSQIWVTLFAFYSDF